jgi:uncharacterized protein
MKLIRMIKVVADTNILLRAFVSARNVERKLINLALAGRITLYGSTVSFDEYKEKIRIDRIKTFYPKKHLSVERMENLYSSVITPIAVTTIAVPDGVCDDEDDVEFIKIALASGSKIVVTHDKHLLKIKKYEGVRFIKPEHFIDSYANARGGVLYS